MSSPPYKTSNETDPATVGNDQPMLRKKTTMRVRSDQVQEAPKDHKKSYMWAFASAVFFAIANCFNAELGKRHGATGPWCAWPAFLITAFGFHLYEYIKFKKTAKEGEGYLDPKHSAYYEEFKEIYEDEIDI